MSSSTFLTLRYSLNCIVLIICIYIKKLWEYLLLHWMERSELNDNYPILSAASWGAGGGVLVWGGRAMVAWEVGRRIGIGGVLGGGGVGVCVEGRGWGLHWWNQIEHWTLCIWFLFCLKKIQNHFFRLSLLLLHY